MASEQKFERSEIEEFKKQFNSFDKNGDGSIDSKELAEALRNLGEQCSPQQVTSLIEEVDADRSGTVEFNEFLWIIGQVRQGRKNTQQGFARVVEKQKNMIQVQGHTGVHSFAQEEMTAFAEHINQCLRADPDLDYLLPIDATGTELCDKVRDGVLLAKFINYAIRDTIDERALNKKKERMSLFQINENLNLVISAAKSIGVVVTNIGATELTKGAEHPHLVLGIVWQLVKIQLLNSVNLSNHPELFRLLEDGEQLSDLLKLPPDQLLLRWFNYHLKNAGSNRRVTNFGSDLKDSECYTILLNRIAPQRCSLAALQENNPARRAQMVLDNARLLGVNPFITPNDIVKGNQRLNLAFTACIFNTCPGLEPLTEEEKTDLAGVMEDDFGDSREERAFRMWINSLGVDNLYINSLFEDCKDGLALLKVIDHIEPGIVAWNKVEMNPNNKFKKVANCNYAVVLGKQLKLSLVGIGGSDIVDGNRKLLLALTWQLMRYHTIKFLQQVKLGGASVTEADILGWANGKVRDAGRSTSMASFKDASLSNSHFFMDLLFAVNRNIINWDLVTPGDTIDEKMSNAKYAISVARKLSCTIFLLPEDIVEVKPKMMLTFIAAIMAVAH
eukprot:TRINITY_DN949_c0_g1_i1.p1 TRINITY_DN949_c0_g1~~TRINITY_DN949_c0_g1_i1.p1  ORF type:complete len:640 (+),score=335.88 TRINITY_DN949_c0_g1_i1:74-1921(+)